MLESEGGAAGGHVLVLWDIDLTLVRSGPATLTAFDDALSAVAGKRLTEKIDFGGRTDLHIAREMLRAHGVLPTDDLITRLLDSFATAFEQDEEARSAGYALPGAREAVHALAAPDIHQSILTGNMARTAPLKLALLGDAAALLRTDTGAYGDDHEDRNKLVPLARRRATAATGHPYQGRRTVLIGDTVHDVEAALRNDAAVIAVASGRTSAETLTAAGAHTVLPDLTDTELVVSAIRTLTREESAA
ncbi:haloacid dehalogenase-like hydrolase [Yinghuangia soli]|uniref:Haloacid dehalogenase-like hydrolase n=1 Tax=Yinghuangia soli TaxID=2908204 RepID=A0AA41TZY6_9ACTN|nr:haloacid dehalogenase-like hydrolase [Yinghuangia soli]MCF2527805.1 haloacid dehalogenase-like hydrolase [Yinghuangia soli]